MLFPFDGSHARSIGDTLRSFSKVRPRRFGVWEDETWDDIRRGAYILPP